MRFPIFPSSKHPVSASGRVMEKAGMNFLPGKYEKNGPLHDAVGYTITPEGRNNTRR